MLDGVPTLYAATKNGSPVRLVQSYTNPEYSDTVITVTGDYLIFKPNSTLPDSDFQAPESCFLGFGGTAPHLYEHPLAFVGLAWTFVATHHLLVDDMMSSYFAEAFATS